MICSMSKRERLTVDREADWTRIIRAVPPGFSPVGVVRRGNGEPGVLALDERSGDYVQLNEGELTILDQRTVRLALGLPELSEPDARH
jgi:hypothetical protein